MEFITEESELKLSSGLTAIYFYSDWLLFHKKMLIMLEKVEVNFSDIVYFAVDVDDFKSLCKRYSVDSIPTVLIIDGNGKEVRRIVGVTLTKAFKAAFADIYAIYGEKNDKKSNQKRIRDESAGNPED